jgi:hypothetical protein
MIRGIREIRVPTRGIRKIFVCQDLERALRGRAATRITVSRQINHVERERSRPNQVEVDEPGLARGGARARQFAADERVDQRGFADIRPADQRNFGQAIPGKVPGRCGADDKFRGDQP